MSGNPVFRHTLLPEMCIRPPCGFMDPTDVSCRCCEIAPVLSGLSTETPAFDTRGVTFGDYLQRWKEAQLHWRPQTAKTVDSYSARMLVPQLGDIELVAMTREDVQSAVTQWAQNYSVSSTKIAYGFVASVYKHAIADRLVQFSPCKRISLPKDQRVRIRPLTDEQVMQIRDNIAPHYKHAVELVASTGLRGGEWRGLTIDRIDLDAGTLRIDRHIVGSSADGPIFGPPKTAAGERTLELSELAAAAIRGQMERYPVTNPWSVVHVAPGLTCAPVGCGRRVQQCDEGHGSATADRLACAAALLCIVAHC